MATQQSPRKSAEFRVNCHSGFRGRPTAAVSTAIRGRPRPLPRRSSDTRRLPRTSAEVCGSCHSTCHGYVRGKLCRTNHSNSRKSATIATAAPAEIAVARTETAVARKSAKVRGNCHNSSHGRSTAAPSTAIRERPRPLPRQSSYTRQLSRKSAEVRVRLGLG